MEDIKAAVQSIIGGSSENYFMSLSRQQKLEAFKKLQSQHRSHNLKTIPTSNMMPNPMIIEEVKKKHLKIPEII